MVPQGGYRSGQWRFRLLPLLKRQVALRARRVPQDGATPSPLSLSLKVIAVGHVSDTTL